MSKLYCLPTDEDLEAIWENSSNRSEGVCREAINGTLYEISVCSVEVTDVDFEDSDLTEEQYERGYRQAVIEPSFVGDRVYCPWGDDCEVCDDDTVCQDCLTEQELDWDGHKFTVTYWENHTGHELYAELESRYGGSWACGDYWPAGGSTGWHVTR